LIFCGFSKKKLSRNKKKWRVLVKNVFTFEKKQNRNKKKMKMFHEK